MSITLRGYRVANTNTASDVARSRPSTVTTPHRQRPLHIVYVSALGGGADTYVRSIARALFAAGHQVTVLYLKLPGEPISGPFNDGGVRIAYARMGNGHYYVNRVAGLLYRGTGEPMPGAAILKSAEASLALRRALHRIVRMSGGVDLIEFLEETSLPFLFRDLPPYAVKLHSSEATWRHFCGEGWRLEDRWRVAMEAGLLRHARLVTAPSAALADHIASICHYPRSLIHVMPYPLNLEQFTPAPRQPFSGAGDSLSVLYVGRMDWRKGIRALMEAAPHILSAAPTATIDIVGGETAEVRFEELRYMLPEPLRHRVIFHGRVPHAQLPGVYQRAAVCVVPSRWDNSPNTVYEAMGCGVPVVASRVGGIPELVADGVTGLLVPPDKSDALAAAVIALLGDLTRREQMGRVARAVAETQFAPALIVEQTVTLYRHAVGQATPVGLVGSTPASMENSTHACS